MAAPEISFMQRLDVVAVLKPRFVILAMIAGGLIGIASIVRVIVVIADPDIDLTVTDVASVVLSLVLFAMAVRAWRRRPVTRAWLDGLRRAGSPTR